MKRISNSDSIHFWMVFQIIKNELVANVCYLIRSGTWPDLWLKWICQWIPKKKMMCLCKWKGSQIQIPFIFAWYFKLQKMCLLPMIVIEFAVELDQIFGWSESANGSQRWRHYADWNKKDLQFGFHSFLHGISNYKKWACCQILLLNLQWNLTRSLVEVNLPMDPKDDDIMLIEIKRIYNLDSIHFCMVFQIQKNELVAKYCYWIGSGTRPDLWLKWICQWIPKMKMMCWCKWKGCPIRIPFIFAWYFKLQKNELVAKYCYWIGSGTWPDLWLKCICQWIPKKKMMCWCKWKGSPIQIPFIFAWYFKLQKNELVAKYCYWIGSGTWPDLLLKWICQWIPKMKMMCWCKWKASPIWIPFIFAW